MGQNTLRGSTLFRCAFWDRAGAEFYGFATRALVPLWRLRPGLSAEDAFPAAYNLCQEWPSLIVVQKTAARLTRSDPIERKRFILFGRRSAGVESSFSEGKITESREQY